MMPEPEPFCDFEPIRLNRDGSLVLLPGPADFVVHLTLGEPETGMWCDKCLLPAAGRSALFANGLHVGDFTACETCDDLTQAARFVADRFIERLRQEGWPMP